MQKEKLLRPRSFLVLASIGFFLLAIVASAYSYRVYSLAQLGDIYGLVHGQLLRHKLPGFRTPASYPRQVGDANVGVPLSAVGYGSTGACGYFLLKKCIALSVDVAIEKHPHLFVQLLQALQYPCKLLLEGEDVPDQRHHFSRLKDRFGCTGAERSDAGVERVILVANVVRDMDFLPKQTDLPGGGVSYARQERAVIYQIAFESTPNQQ